MEMTISRPASPNITVRLNGPNRMTATVKGVTRSTIQVSSPSHNTVSRTVSEVILRQVGIQGPKGDDASPSFVHTQTFLNSSWTVTHNLDRRPLLQLIVGGEVVAARVTYPSLNSALVEFATPVVGTANCY